MAIRQRARLEEVPGDNELADGRGAELHGELALARLGDPDARRQQGVAEAGPHGASPKSVPALMGNTWVEPRNVRRIAEPPRPGWHWCPETGSCS